MNSHVEQLDVKTAHQLIDTGAFFLDVREKQEYEAGHASGAISIPLSELGEHLDGIPLERDIVIICKSGGRSNQACEALSALGYHVNNVVGGSLEWYAQGLEFVSDSGEATVL